MDQPILARHFLIELARCPASVTGEQLEFLRAGKGIAQVHQSVEGMPHVQVKHDVGLGYKNVAMQETQGARLHRAAHEKRLALDRLRQIRHQGLAHFALGGPVQDQAESALRIMLANQHDGAMEKGPVQFAAIEQQLPLQGFMTLGHNPVSFHQLTGRVNNFFCGQSVLLIKVLGDIGRLSKFPLYAQ